MVQIDKERAGGACQPHYSRGEGGEDLFAKQTFIRPPQQRLPTVKTIYVKLIEISGGRAEKKEHTFPLQQSCPSTLPQKNLNFFLNI